MENIIKILIDESCEMAVVLLNDECVMEGNYWDFYNGCHDIQEYGEFNNYFGLVIGIQNKVGGKIIKESYNHGG